MRFALACLFLRDFSHDVRDVLTATPLDERDGGIDISNFLYRQWVKRALERRGEVCTHPCLLAAATQEVRASVELSRVRGGGERVGRIGSGEKVREEAGVVGEGQRRRG